MYAIIYTRALIYSGSAVYFSNTVISFDAAKGRAMLAKSLLPIHGEFLYYAGCVRFSLQEKIIFWL
jgi:hypothetical protein